MIFQLFNDPVQVIAFLAAILLTISVHEAAHALAASFLGDDTAKLMGRLTLNPLAHLDPVGSLLFLLAGFGWGKPVPVNPNNFSNPVVDNFFVALAGPFSNLLMAIAFGLPLRFLGNSLQPWAVEILVLLVFINLALMIFNLIPIPPLDGSKVIGIIFGETVLYRLEAMSLPILIIFLILARSGFPLFSYILVDLPNIVFQFITGTKLPF